MNSPRFHSTLVQQGIVGLLSDLRRDETQNTLWKHQMETLSALLALCAGNSLVTGEFPSQRPVTRSFDIFLNLHLNERLSKQWWGWRFETQSLPLWRHCNEFTIISYRDDFRKHKEIYPHFLCFSNLSGNPPPRNIANSMITDVLTQVTRVSSAVALA